MQDLEDEARYRLRKVKGLLRHKNSLRSIYSTVPLTIRPFLRVEAVPITESLQKNALFIRNRTLIIRRKVASTVWRPVTEGFCPLPPASSKEPASALAERLIPQKSE